jgi:hypothetical protein
VIENRERAGGTTLATFLPEQIGGIAMKAHALVTALALAAALLAPPLADAGGRHRSDRDYRTRSRQHGYYYYQAPRAYGHGYYRYRPYYRGGYRYYAPPVPYYGYYPVVPYGYGYYPPPYYYTPRSGFYLNLGFGFRF